MLYYTGLNDIMKLTPLGISLVNIKMMSRVAVDETVIELWLVDVDPNLGAWIAEIGAENDSLIKAVMSPLGALGRSWLF